MSYGDRQQHGVAFSGVFLVGEVMNLWQSRMVCSFRFLFNYRQSRRSTVPPRYRQGTICRTVKCWRADEGERVNVFKIPRLYNTLLSEPGLIRRLFA